MIDCGEVSSVLAYYTAQLGFNSYHEQKKSLCTVALSQGYGKSLSLVMPIFLCV